MGLIARSVVKKLWGIADADTSQDDVIDILITQCSARIELFVGRALEAATRTEYYEGTGDEFLLLRHRPVTLDVDNPVRVWEDLGGASGQAEDAFAADTELTIGVDFELLRDGPNGRADSGLLRRIRGAWQKPMGFEGGIISAVPVPTGCSVKVTYKAGFASDAIPADLQQACLMLMALTKKSLDTGQPLSNESWEAYSYTVQVAAAGAFGDLPAATLTVLGNYRGPRLG